MVFTLFWCKSYTILVLWVGDGLNQTVVYGTKFKKQRACVRHENDGGFAELFWNCTDRETVEADWRRR